MIRGSAKSAQEALKACIDCGKPSGDLHTCSPQANRLETMIFVYRHKITGHINALYHEDALDAAKRDDLEHLATLEPRLFIQAHYAKVSGAADPVLPSAGETTGPVSAAPTLREAAQQALEIFDLGILREEQHRRVEALRAALAEPVQPVAWANEIIDDLHALHDSEMIREIDSGDALIRLECAIAAVEEAEARFTAPPQRKPLSDEESDRLILDRMNLDRGTYAYALALVAVRETEAAHGIREGGAA